MTARRRCRRAILRPAVLGGCVALASLGCVSLGRADEERLAVFDTYWQALADSYPYFGHKGVDWSELRAQYRSATVYARRPAEFYHLLTGMLSQLDDPHVALTVPASNWRELDVAATSLDDLEGFSRFVLERRIHVASWPDGGEPVPPDHLSGEATELPQIVRIEGVPVVWPLVENLFLGPPESAAELVLRWSDGSQSRHVLHRPAAPPPRVVVRQDGVVELRLAGKHTIAAEQAATLAPMGGFSLLRIKTFSRTDLRPDGHTALTRHLDALVDQAMASEGLIVDLRDNGGGDYEITQKLAGRFLRQPYMQVLSEQTSSRFFGLLTYSMFPHVNWEPRPPVFDKPLVVLTSWHTGSAAEHLARLLQTERGAIVVGERTIGAEAAVQKVNGPDGSTLSFGGTRLLDVRGRGLQDEGVVPDVAVRLRLSDVKHLTTFAAARADWDERVLRAARDALAARRARPDRPPAPTAR